MYAKDFVKQRRKIELNEQNKKGGIIRRARGREKGKEKGRERKEKREEEKEREREREMEGKET